MKKVSAVITARNEEKYLAETIFRLKQQTLHLKQIVVVNDGSTDKTPQIARNSGCTVIDLPYHKENFVGRPELAERLNAGLKILSQNLPDYILILGADHFLPSNYVEELVSRMESDTKLVIASGRIKGEPCTEFAPRGSGRLVKTWFWKQVNNIQYPVVWGWESWLYFKAMQLGYKTKCLNEIESEVKRPTSLDKSGHYGKAMYALGYDWKYAVGRCLLMFLHSPKAGLSMFCGFVRHRGVERLDIAGFTSVYQKRRIKQILSQLMKGKNPLKGRYLRE